MYHIYTTEALVLKRTNFGEANVLVYLLTKDLGLIMASAQSVRSQKSKLSSALTEYSYITLSLVKGKNGWKITNAIPKENLFFDYPPVAKNIVAKISNVLIKLIAGEEKHPEIFDTILDGFIFLKNLEEEEIFNFESLILLRLLYHLGYIAKNEEIGLFLNNNELDEEILQKVSEQKGRIVSLINKGLKESQL